MNIRTTSRRDITNLWSLYPASQQTRDIVPMLVQCWFTVYDAGPTLNQQWDNVSCLLGLMSLPRLFVSHMEEVNDLCISASRKTRHIEALLGQLSRRWPSIEPALVQCAFFAGTWSGDIDRDSVCPSVVITALCEFKITKPVMQSTEPQGYRYYIEILFNVPFRHW